MKRSILVGLAIVTLVSGVALSEVVPTAGKRSASSSTPAGATSDAPPIGAAASVTAGTAQSTSVTDASTAPDATITGSSPPTLPTLPASATSAVGFTATFDSPSDFYDRFDYGFSGQDPATNHNADRTVAWTGDHDASCGAPTTSRAIDIDRDTDALSGGSYDDFDDMFWWCRDHIMTSVNSVGYSIAWFAPKPLFADVSRVCWDINVTDMSSRKWTQVLFVSESDSVGYPSRRGSGGYDLGFTNPTFRDQPGAPSTGILPRSGDLAGLQIQQRGYFGWFQHQDQWNADLNPSAPVIGSTDKAARYTHCVEQITPDTIRFTQQRPAEDGGFQQIEVRGTIPPGPVRVVFQDDNYNGPKGEHYDPDVNTWHWDNIVIETDSRTGSVDEAVGSSTSVMSPSDTATATEG